MQSEPITSRVPFSVPLSRLVRPADLLSLNPAGAIESKEFTLIEQLREVALVKHKI